MSKRKEQAERGFCYLMISTRGDFVIELPPDTPDPVLKWMAARRWFSVHSPEWEGAPRDAAELAGIGDRPFLFIRPADDAVYRRHPGVSRYDDMLKAHLAMNNGELGDVKFELRPVKL